MLKISQADLLTPANAITVAGLVLTLVGVFRLDTMGGFGLALGGRLLDALDGPIARRTHASHFGALFDAGSDKLCILAILLAMFYFGLAPVLFLAFVLLYHAGVMYMSLDAEKHGLQAKPTRLGKNTMILHLAALLSFVLANALSHGGNLVFIAASALALAGVISGAISFTNYAELYIKEVWLKPEEPKSHK